MKHKGRLHTVTTKYLASSWPAGGRRITIGGVYSSHLHPPALSPYLLHSQSSGTFRCIDSQIAMPRNGGRITGHRRFQNTSMLEERNQNLTCLHHNRDATHELSIHTYFVTPSEDTYACKCWILPGRSLLSMLYSQVLPYLILRLARLGRSIQPWPAYAFLLSLQGDGDLLAPPVVYVCSDDSFEGSDQVASGPTCWLALWFWVWA